MADNRNNDQESESNMYSCSQCPSKFKQRPNSLGISNGLEKGIIWTNINIENIQLRSVKIANSQHAIIINWEIIR